MDRLLSRNRPGFRQTIFSHSKLYLSFYTLKYFVHLIKQIITTILYKNMAAVFVSCYEEPAYIESLSANFVQLSLDESVKIGTDKKT